MNLVFTVFRVLIASSVGCIIWGLLYFNFDISFWNATAYAIGGGALLFWIMQMIVKLRYLKSQQLKLSEYAFIRKNLREAKGKIRRLRKTYIHVRSLRTFNQVLYANRLVKKIYTIVKREPKRFYRAERFFFYHLDSMVELTEKHTFLAAQSVKDRKIKESLSETRRMLDELNKTVEQDLSKVLASDVDHLNFELDVAKHALSTWKNPLKEGKPENERT